MGGTSVRYLSPPWLFKRLLSVSRLSCLPGIYLKHHQKVHTIEPFKKKKKILQERSDIFREVKFKHIH